MASSSWLRSGFVFLLAALVAPAAEPILTVVTPLKTISFAAGELAAMPRQEITVQDMHDTLPRRYGGVAMREVLQRAGAPLGEEFRGVALTTGVLVRCRDGYTVLFALAEFDEAFSARTIVLADRENGELLTPSAAPLRLVCPGDKRGARSARQVASLELVALARP